MHITIAIAIAIIAIARQHHGTTTSSTSTPTIGDNCVIAHRAPVAVLLKPGADARHMKEVRAWQRGDDRSVEREQAYRAFHLANTTGEISSRRQVIKDVLWGCVPLIFLSRHSNAQLKESPLQPAQSISIWLRVVPGIAPANGSQPLFSGRAQWQCSRASTANSNASLLLVPTKRS